MKIYVPQKGDILLLEKNWYIELPSDLKKKYFPDKEYIPKGTKLTITEYQISYHKITSIKMKILEVNGKKVKMMKYHAFSVKLNDFNSMHIETDELSGVMNIDLYWDSSYRGFIDDKIVFTIDGVDLYYFNKLIGTYKSKAACRRNALKYAKNNYFKNKIRSHKIKTLYDKE